MEYWISTELARNSELQNLIKKGILKPGEERFANLPSGNKIKLEYVIKQPINNANQRNAGVHKYIKKSILNRDDSFIVSKHAITENKTHLTSIEMYYPKGNIEQIYEKDGTCKGRIRTTDSNVVWIYTGNVQHPNNVSVESNELENDNVEAFKAAINYIRGKGTLEAYKAQITK